MLPESGFLVIRTVTVVLVLALAVLGAVWIWKFAAKGPVLAVALSLLVVHTAPTSIASYSRKRFSYPSLPFALLLLVAGLVWGTSRWRQSDDAEAQLADGGRRYSGSTKEP